MKNKCVCQWAAIDTINFLFQVSMIVCYITLISRTYIVSQLINTEYERRLISISTEQILITYTALMEFSSELLFNTIYNIYEFKLKIIACVI